MPDFFPWPFPVSKGTYAGTDTRVSRTLPVRLSEVVNVKDWGAAGSGSGDDSTKIQAAINFCMSRGGGTVFFPAGNYNLGAGTFLTVGSSDPNISVRLLGASGGAQAGASNVNGFYDAGYLISKGGSTYDNLASIEAMTVTNNPQVTPLGGAVRFVGSGASFRNCTFGGLNCLDLSDADGCTVMACLGYGFDGDAGAASTYPRSLKGVGFYLGNRCLITNCRLNGNFFIGYALSGNGAALLSCGVESINTGCRVGWASGGTVSGQEREAVACTVQGLGTEKCWTGIDVYWATGCSLQNCVLTGGHGQPAPQAINTAVWSSTAGGQVLVTTAANHFLSAGVHNLQVDIGVNVGNGTHDNPNPWRTTAFTPCTSAGPATNTFTYPLAVNPGAASLGASPAWTYPLEYSLRVRKATDCAFIGNELLVNAVVAAGDLDYGGSAAHKNNIIVSSVGGRGWIPPTGPNAASWKFISVGQLAPDADSIATAGNPCATMVFANLPGQSGVLQPGPYEAQEFDITDGRKSAGVEAGFAEVVIGGGVGRYKVRYNGSNWIRIG